MDTSAVMESSIPIMAIRKRQHFLHHKEKHKNVKDGSKALQWYSQIFPEEVLYLKKPPFTAKMTAINEIHKTWVIYTDFRGSIQSI